MPLNQLRRYKSDSAWQQTKTTAMATATSPSHPEQTARASKTRFCQIASQQDPFPLQGGSTIGPCTIAYETYGELNADRSNAILLFHALSGSQHAAGYDPVGPANRFWVGECPHGWWDAFVGPGRALDTTRYFVISANFLGGCYGSTGPSSLDPATGKPYGGRFPWISVSDVVDSQMRLLDHLGIDRLLAAIGGSIGGLCVMDLATRFPARLKCAIPIASGLRTTVLTKTLNFEQIFAIQEDPDFNSGDYYDGPFPRRGLALARMISHKTYVSLSVMEARARKEIIQPNDLLSSYKLQHRIESYMMHQGNKFVERFDANSYLRIINVWQSFDLTRQSGGDAVAALKPCIGQKWLLFSIDSDVCFYPEEQSQIVDVLKTNGIDCQHITVHSDKGHDAFLLEPESFTPHIVFKLVEASE